MGINLTELDSVAGTLSVTGNGAGTAEVILGSLTNVDGDIYIDSAGDGTFDLGPVSPGGATDLALDGYDAVEGTTASGDTTVENGHGDAVMRLHLPEGTYDTPVQFTLTRQAPGSLPPENGTDADGNPAAVDPLAGYEFGFTVPTLDLDATLSLEVLLDGLDQPTRDAFLAALDEGTATLATKDDAGGNYQAFALCTGPETPATDGCVAVETLDANGQPTTGTPKIVRFTGVTGHFSTWAVATLAPPTPTYQPDALVKKSSATSFVGDGTYAADGTGQTATIKVKRGKKATFDLRFQNDDAPDTLEICGAGSQGKFKVKYLDAGSVIVKAVTTVK